MLRKAEALSGAQKYEAALEIYEKISQTDGEMRRSKQVQVFGTLPPISDVISNSMCGLDAPEVIHRMSHLNRSMEPRLDSWWGTLSTLSITFGCNV